MAAFIHHDLRLLNPLFSSPLPDVITELEHLRRLNIRVDACQAAACSFTNVKLP